MINNKYPTTKPSLNLDFANTKSLDPRINFRRGTPGTYYDGVTHAKAEENLLSYSEDFSVWSGTPTLLEPLAVGGASPIGTQAYKFIADTTPSSTTYGYLPLSKSELLTSYSIHVKADGLNYAWFGVCWNGSNYVSFVVDLTTGQVLDNYTRNRDNILIDTDVTDIGNGWYRVKYVSDGYTANYMSIGGFSNPPTDLSSSGLPTFSGDGVSGILLWGAQVETRNAVTSYTATNGTPITKYQPKLMTASPDDARFDHDPITGEGKGLLIEEQRTNLISYSEDFGNAAWIKQNGHPYESNVAVGLDGSVSATRIYKTSDQWIRYEYTQAGTYTLSCWVKSEATSGDFTMESYNHADNSANGSDSFTATNKWKRFSRTVTIDTSGGTTSWYPCIPANTNEKFYIWGAQLEAGPFPTSYIKTTGASATRSADNASITGENFSSWYRQDEGSVYSEISSFDPRDSQARITLSDGTDSNRIFMAANIGSNILKVDGWGSSNIGDYDLDINNFQVNKIYKKSFGLKRNDYFISIDGQSESGITSQDVPLPLVDRFDFSTRSVSHYVNGHIKKLAYYPQRLTNEQLQNLTK